MRTPNQRAWAGIYESRIKALQEENEALRSDLNRLMQMNVMLLNEPEKQVLTKELSE